jgi:predicted phosphoribosyltransferase
MKFQDRKDGGKQLIPKLEKYKGMTDVVLLGLPRGGVVTAYEISKKLKLPLDIVVPRKIGAPGNEELAIGAITESGEGIMNEEIMSYLGVDDEYVKETIEKEKKEAMRRLKLYRGGKKAIDIKGKIVILIDDGVATGSTMRAAIASAKAKGVKKIVVAVPVIARDTLRKIEKEADEVIYLDAPFIFGAVGRFYEVFDQTEDEEVVEIMKKV